MPGGRRVSSLQWWKKGESAFLVQEIYLWADTLSHTASSKPSADRERRFARLNRSD